MKKSTKNLIMIAGAAIVGVYFYKKYQKSIAKEKAMKSATEEFEDEEADEYSDVVSGRDARIFPSSWLNASVFNDASGNYDAGAHYRGDLWPDKWAHKGAERQPFFNAVVVPCPEAGGRCTYQQGGRRYSGYIDGVTCRCVPSGGKIASAGGSII